jgi:hypothetical protein
MTDDELGAAVERVLGHALDNPIPKELREAIADQIEPYTINAYLKHDEVMTCIKIAFPLIRDYLARQAETT